VNSLPSLPDEPPRWRGVNHLALVTTDMDATVRLYHGVLGARLIATLGVLAETGTLDWVPHTRLT